MALATLRMTGFGLVGQTMSGLVLDALGWVGSSRGGRAGLGSAEQGTAGLCRAEQFSSVDFRK